MSKFKLSLETLAQIDNGHAKLLFDKEVEKCIEDCRDRANLLKPREIAIKLKMQPHPQDQEDVVIAIEVLRAKVPGSVTDAVRMQTNGKNEASFQSLSNDNPHQPDLAFDERDVRDEDDEE